MPRVNRAMRIMVGIRLDIGSLHFDISNKASKKIYKKNERMISIMRF